MSWRTSPERALMLWKATLREAEATLQGVALERFKAVALGNIATLKRVRKTTKGFEFLSWGEFKAIREDSEAAERRALADLAAGKISGLLFLELVGDCQASVSLAKARLRPFGGRRPVPDTAEPAGEEIPAEVQWHRRGSKGSEPWVPLTQEERRAGGAV